MYSRAAAALSCSFEYLRTFPTEASKPNQNGIQNSLHFVLMIYANYICKSSVINES